VPGESLFVWKQDTPFALHGLQGLLLGGAALQEVYCGIETIRDKRLQFGDPQTTLLLYRDLKASRIPEEYHTGSDHLMA
jgi:hypothetical protein